MQPPDESDEGESEALKRPSEKLVEMWARNDASRVALAARLRSEGAVEEAMKLEACNQTMVLRCSACHHPVRGRTACKRRWCPVCARVLAAERVSIYETCAKLITWPLHVTLTIRNVEDLRFDTLKKLLRDFKRLRATRLWSRSVTGGMVALEITHKGRGWHPHLHILCDCQFLAYKTMTPQRYHSKERKAALYQAAAVELHDEWCRITEQRTASIKARRCAASEAVREVLKYAVKGSEMLAYKGRAADVIAAMKSTRLFACFGSLYGRRAEMEAEQKQPCACAACGEKGTMMPEEVLARLTKYDGKRSPHERRVTR